MPPAALATMLGTMGITKDTTVVVYSETGDFKAPYLVWALDYLGHRSALVLEGDSANGKKRGNAVTQDYPAIKAVAYRKPAKLRKEVRASLEDVKKVVMSGGAVLLDVRTVDLYTGEKGAWKRKGHIKGALSRFWGEDLKADGNVEGPGRVESCL